MDCGATSTHRAGTSSKPAFRTARAFEQGVAPAYDQKAGWLLLKQDGTTQALPLEITGIDDFRNGLTMARTRAGPVFPIRPASLRSRQVPSAEAIWTRRRSMRQQEVSPVRFHRPVWAVCHPARIRGCPRLASVRVNGKWGFIDRRGNLVISPHFLNAREFSVGLCAVKIELQPPHGKWGYIDKSGRVVRAPQFVDVAGPF